MNVHAFLNSVSRAAVRLLDIGVQQEEPLQKLLGVNSPDPGRASSSDGESQGKAGEAGPSGPESEPSSS